MGVFSLLVLHSALVLLERGPATWATPKTSQHRPPRIKLPAWKKKSHSNHFAYNAAVTPPMAIACVPSMLADKQTILLTLYMPGIEFEILHCNCYYCHCTHTE